MTFHVKQRYLVVAAALVLFVGNEYGCMRVIADSETSGTPPVYIYAYRDPSSEYNCLKIATQFDITIEYNTTYGQSAVEHVAQPSPSYFTADPTGNCESKNASFVAFSTPDAPNPVVLRLEFRFTRTSKGIADMRIDLNYDARQLSNSSETDGYVFVTTDENLSLSDVNHSYYCNLTKTYHLGRNVKITVGFMQAQGFHMEKGDFSLPDGNGCGAINVTTPRTTHKTHPTKTHTMPKTTHKTHPTPTHTMPTTTHKIHPTPTHTVHTTTHKPSSTTNTMPVPPTANNTFYVGNKTKPCLVMKVAIDLYIKQTKGEKSISVPAMKDLTISGACDNTTETLELSWKNTEIDVTLVFGFSSFGSNFSLGSVSVNYTLLAMKPPVSKHLPVNGLNELSTAIGSHYVCNNVTRITLDNSTRLEMMNLQLQGFRKKNGTDLYGSENNCRTSNSGSGATTNNTVPIVVAGVLGGMVVVVIIGYIIGRRRSRRATGYENLS